MYSVVKSVAACMVLRDCTCIEAQHPSDVGQPPFLHVCVDERVSSFLCDHLPVIVSHRAADSCRRRRFTIEFEEYNTS